MSASAKKYGYPAPYYAAFDAMVATGNYWGLAPIHHGCFENGWRGALLVAAGLADEIDPSLAARIRELGVYTNEDGSKHYATGFEPSVLGGETE